MVQYNFLQAIKLCGYNTTTLAKVMGKSQTSVYQSLTNPNIQLSSLQNIANYCTNGDVCELLRIALLSNETDIIDRIYNVDYSKGICLLKDKSIDLVVTDPPYLFIKGGWKNPNNNAGKMARGSYLYEQMSDFDGTQIEELLDSLFPKFKTTYNAYFFCSEMQLVYYLKWATDHKLRYNVLIWDRQHKCILSLKYFRSNIDYIVRIYGRGQSLRELSTNDIDKMSLYSKIKVSKEGTDTEHETEKPVSIIKEFINLSSDNGDIVLDPFLGSGTTAIASMELGRHYIGFEINKEIYDMAVNRIGAYSNAKSGIEY